MQGNHGNVSEVARIRQQIEDEIASIAHMDLFATTAKHEVVNAKYKAIDDGLFSLTQHVGAEDANKYVCETYIRIVG